MKQAHNIVEIDTKDRVGGPSGYLTHIETIAFGERGHGCK